MNKSSPSCEIISNYRLSRVADAITIEPLTREYLERKWWSKHRYDAVGALSMMYVLKTFQPVSTLNDTPRVPDSQTLAHYTPETFLVEHQNT